MTGTRTLPTRPGTALSLLAGTVTFGMLAPAANLVTVALVALGTAVCIAGARGLRGASFDLRAPHATDLAGGAGVVAGVGLALFALAPALAAASGYGVGATLLAGGLGLVVLGAGLAPARRGRERALVSAGTGLLLLAVVASAASRRAALLTVLAATVTTVCAWDAGEQAVSLGEQVGVRAQTAEVELVHLLGSLAVGAVAVVVALGISVLGPTGLPLAVLVALLAAAVTLSVSLYN